MAYLVFLYLFHPVHVSVTEVYFNEVEHTIQISQRIFIDDLEQAILMVIGPDELKSEDLKSAIGSYLLANNQILIDGNQKRIQYLGSEIEDAVLWSYLEVLDVHRPKKISYRCDILLQQFKDQENLVHIKGEKMKKSLRLNKNQPSDSIWLSK